MPFDWDQYLIFAKGLRDNPDLPSIPCDREAIDRSIVSRSYYSAFHCARIYAENQRKKPFDWEGIHIAVQMWYRDNRRNSPIPQDLRDFSKIRNQCDYDDDVENLQDLIISSIKTAGKIKFKIQSY